MANDRPNSSQENPIPHRTRSKVHRPLVEGWNGRESDHSVLACGSTGSHSYRRLGSVRCKAPAAVEGLRCGVLASQPLGVVDNPLFFRSSEAFRCAARILCRIACRAHRWSRAQNSAPRPTTTEIAMRVCLELDMACAFVDSSLTAGSNNAFLYKSLLSYDR